MVVAAGGLFAVYPAAFGHPWRLLIGAALASSDFAGIPGTWWYVPFYVVVELPSLLLLVLVLTWFGAAGTVRSRPAAAVATAGQGLRAGPPAGGSAAAAGNRPAVPPVQRSPPAAIRVPRRCAHRHLRRLPGPGPQRPGARGPSRANCPGGDHGPRGPRPGCGPAAPLPVQLRLREPRPRFGGAAGGQRLLEGQPARARAADTARRVRRMRSVHGRQRHHDAPGRPGRRRRGAQPGLPDQPQQCAPPYRTDVVDDYSVEPTFLAVYTDVVRVGSNCDELAAVVRSPYGRNDPLSAVARCRLVLSPYPPGGIPFTTADSGKDFLLGGWTPASHHPGVAMNAPRGQPGLRDPGTPHGASSHPRPAGSDGSGCPGAREQRAGALRPRG